MTYSLLFVGAGSRAREVFFETKSLMRHWQEIILREQGFWGARISAYENVDVIGNGSYGVVSLVRHVNSKQLYAIKKVREDTLAAESSEHNLMERLSSCKGSKNFVSTYETFTCDTY